MIGGVTAIDTHAAIETCWRIESTRLIGALVRITRDLTTAEDLAHDALVTALEEWPRTGIPQNPGAWLLTAARRRAIDQFRRAAMVQRKQDALVHDIALIEQQPPDFDAALDDHVGDDVLRLIFAACHPVLSAEARVALTLRLVGGLTTAEIARAFLVGEPTIAQRIVRAKRTLAKAGVPFAVPRGADLDARLASVLEVIYLVFNEGYSATSGDDWMRPALCEDAQRLGRVLAELAPEAAEVHGLVALMEIQASRARARVGQSGEPILLLEQNRARWDQLLIRRGLAALDRALALGQPHGPYVLQAAIAACHARARTADETDWSRIAQLYSELAQVASSPVVELNRAVAVAMADGPAAGLAIVDALRDHPSLAEYHLLPSVRADLLVKLGRRDEARIELERAVSLTNNAREHQLLVTRIRSLG